MGPVENNFSIRILIFLVFLVLIDLYAFQAFRHVIKNYSKSAIRLINTTYWIVSILCFTLIVLAIGSNWHNWNRYFRTYSFAFLIIIIFSKFVLDIFILIDDMVRFLRWLFMKIS
jgi:hypothetical protein